MPGWWLLCGTCCSTQCIGAKLLAANDACRVTLPLRLLCLLLVLLAQHHQLVGCWCPATFGAATAHRVRLAGEGPRAPLFQARSSLPAQLR